MLNILPFPTNKYKLKYGDIDANTNVGNYFLLFVESNISPYEIGESDISFWI